VQNLDWLSYQTLVGADIGTMSIKQVGGQADGLLRQWDPIDAKISTHYGYAFQWFALSAATFFIYIWYQVWRPRRRLTKESNHG
jgi:surfeit locus 1 family protein